ncbi:hypothetical protein FJZ17_03385 [Candidatus Pacearchaeota archaeon]|nr:hypothetical protein [Candidatus Pacearchaeota archaeon]
MSLTNSERTVRIGRIMSALGLLAILGFTAIPDRIVQEHPAYAPVTVGSAIICSAVGAGIANYAARRNKPYSASN